MVENKNDTACGDRTHDQSIKSRTLYLTELRRHTYINSIIFILIYIII